MLEKGGMSVFFSPITLVKNNKQTIIDSRAAQASLGGGEGSGNPIDASAEKQVHQF